jgi:hypothetical protein
MSLSPIELREHAKHNRKLAQEATDLAVIRRLLEIAEDLDAEADRQQNAQSD